MFYRHNAIQPLIFPFSLDSFALVLTLLLKNRLYETLSICANLGLQ